jgi:hypothetical protein
MEKPRLLRRFAPRNDKALSSSGNVYPSYFFPMDLAGFTRLRTSSRGIHPPAGAIQGGNKQLKRGDCRNTVPGVRDARLK